MSAMPPAHEQPGAGDWDGLGLLESVWRFRWIVIAVVLVAGAAGYGLSTRQATLYEASARLFLTDPRTVGVFQDTRLGTGTDPTRYVRNQAEFATSTPVLVRGADILRTPVDRVRDRVSAQGSVDLDLLVIRALAPTPEEAVALADAMAEAYQQLVAEDVARNAEAAVAELEQSRVELQARVDRAEANLAGDPENPALRAERDAAVAQLITVQGRGEQITVDAALYGSGVKLFEPAELPSSPAQPQPDRNAAVAAVLGLLGAAAWAWWWAERTQSADSRQDAARVLGAPLLGDVPDFADVGVSGPDPSRTAPHSPVGEAYQFIVASLEYAIAEAGGTTVLVTSAGQGDGKSTTALNLAIAASREGRAVILVDADERMRALTTVTGGNPEPGLTDLGDSDLPFEGCVTNLAIGEGLSCRFIPAGSRVADPARFFRTAAFRKGIQRIRARGDLVILDSPPLLAVADASAVASHVDGIVLVVTRGTPLRVLEETRERLEFVGVALLGYVFNRSDIRAGRPGRYGRSSYGYGYGHGYGTKPPNGATNGKRPRLRGRKHRRDDPPEDAVPVDGSPPLAPR